MIARRDMLLSTGAAAMLPAKAFAAEDIALPGRLVMPTVDEVSGSSGQVPEGGAVGDPAFHAITGHMVMKKDAPLSYVKEKAQLLSEAAPSRASAVRPISVP